MNQTVYSLGHEERKNREIEWLYVFVPLSIFCVAGMCMCVCGDYFWKTEFSGIQNKRLRHHLKATHHILQPGYEVDMERDSDQCLNAGQMVF